MNHICFQAQEFDSDCANLCVWLHKSATSQEWHFLAQLVKPTVNFLAAQNPWAEITPRNWGCFPAQTGWSSGEWGRHVYKAKQSKQRWRLHVRKHDSKYFLEGFYSENFNTIPCTNSGVELQLKEYRKGKTSEHLMLHCISLIHKQKKKEFQPLLYFTTKPTSLAFKQLWKQNLLNVLGQLIYSPSYLTPAFVGKISYSSLLQGIECSVKELLQ